MGIAPAALAALGNDMRLTVGEVGNNPAAFRVTHHGTHRHLHDQISALFAEAAPRLAIAAVLRLVFALVAEIRQCGKMGGHHKHNIAALAAVAAVGAARRHIFFTVKGHRAVAAVACLQFDFCLVNKHFLYSPPVTNYSITAHD